MLREQGEQAIEGRGDGRGPMKDVLFLLPPAFDVEGEGPWFCPDCAPIEGLLANYPTLKGALDIRYVSRFARPRAEMVALLGEAHQGCPTLACRTRPRSVESVEANGWHVVADPGPIARALREKYGIPRSRADR
jgi:hypothetical protein